MVDNRYFEPLFYQESQPFNIAEGGGVFNNDSLNKLSGKRVCTIDKDEVTFDFVGFVGTGRNVTVILPKYLGSITNKEKNLNVAREIFKVLKKYSDDKNKDAKYRETEDDFFLADWYGEEDAGEMRISEFIIRDFLYNGIYEKNIGQTVLNGSGDIVWQKTVDELDPIFCDDSALCCDTYNSAVNRDLYGDVVRIHSWAVGYCVKKYADFLFDYPHDSIAFIEEVDVDSIGTSEFILSVLKNELAEVYEDRKIMLLKALIGLFEQKCTLDRHGEFSLYGTREFHVIWEYVLNKAFSGDNLLTEYIKGPIWKDFNYNAVEKAPLRPDIVKVFDSKLYIFDAKYYNIKYSEAGKFTVSYNPGVPDITKQIVYEDILKKEISQRCSEGKVVFTACINAFLFPSDRSDKIKNGYRIFGLVKQEPISGFIFNIYIDAARVFTDFLSGGSTIKLQDIGADAELRVSKKTGIF